MLSGNRVVVDDSSFGHMNLGMSLKSWGIAVTPIHTSIIPVTLWTPPHYTSRPHTSTRGPQMPALVCSPRYTAQVA
jgi:hypothetical protein